MPNPIFVAHRGYPAHYPENSLTGIQAALQAGAQAIEFDVQASADGIPIVFHDTDLLRVTGQAGKVTALPIKTLQQLSVGEPQRFGNHYADTRLSTLSKLVALLKHWPGVQIFVEIKTESLQHIPELQLVKSILSATKSIAAQTCIISYAASILQTARQLGCDKLGWILKNFDAETQQQATVLAPGILICNHKKIPADTGLWAGSWQWMLYETDDPAIVQKCQQLGAHYIETDNIGKVLQINQAPQYPIPAL